LKLVVDTSVVIKWFVEEEDFEHARRIVETPLQRLAPELVIVEAANVIQRKMRVRQLDSTQATFAVRQVQYFFDDLVSSAELIRPAFELSKKLDHSVYDCMFLTLALMEDDRKLVTSDLKFIDKASAAGFGEKIWTLKVAGDALAAAKENGNG
jgi:predicted nucleic acid-binding protein